MVGVAVAAVLVLGIVGVGALYALAVQATAHTQERSELLDQIAALCQRIQAPERAVAEHTALTLPVVQPPAVSLDDDVGFFESKEAFADRMMAEELEEQRA